MERTCRANPLGLLGSRVLTKQLNPPANPSTTFVALRYLSSNPAFFHFRSQSSRCLEAGWPSSEIDSSFGHGGASVPVGDKASHSDSDVDSWEESEHSIERTSGWEITNSLHFSSSSPNREWSILRVVRGGGTRGCRWVTMALLMTSVSSKSKWNPILTLPMFTNMMSGVVSVVTSIAKIGGFERSLFRGGSLGTKKLRDRAMSCGEMRERILREVMTGVRVRLSQVIQRSLPLP